MKYLLFLIFAVQACLPGFAACDGRVRIVPRPAEVEELPGSFRLTPRTPVVITDEQLRTPAEIFARAVGKLTGTEPAVTAAPEKHAVTLQLQPGYEAEEYLLEVGRQRITVTASTPQAVLHGLRSLQQLVAGGEIPACVVRDKPTFAYRGAMLDVCRHFFPVKDVKTYIDILSLHKINKFHWHLTDDQGWRIEIKKYPLLTQIGSRRAETLVGRYDKNKEGVYDGKPYGGFYTQEEIREIVSYAAERHIEVIPEIEMPGHGLAALTAYPWLGCTGGPYAVWTHWGISDENLFFALRAFCDEQHPLAYADITYGCYGVWCGLMHIPSHIIPLKEDFTLDPKDYYGLNQTIVLANPNAPTGIALPRAEIEGILKANPNNVVIVDEVVLSP